MRVFDGLETAVLTAVLDEEDDFRRGTPGRAFRAAVALAVVVVVVLAVVAAVVLAVVAVVVLVVVAFVATTFRRPRGGRSGLAFLAFSFLRSSFDEAESPSSLAMVLYTGWSLVTAAVGFGGCDRWDGGRFGDDTSETSTPSGIVGVVDD